MALRDDLHALVDALSTEQTPVALGYLRRLVAAPDALTARMGPASLRGQDFMASKPESAAALAAAQGVRPIESVEALRTDLWPTDPEDDPDRFVETLRRWRRDDRDA